MARPNGNLGLTGASQIRKIGEREHGDVKRADCQRSGQAAPTLRSLEGAMGCRGKRSCLESVGGGGIGSLSWAAAASRAAQRGARDPLQTQVGSDLCRRSLSRYSWCSCRTFSPACGGSTSYRAPERWLFWRLSGGYRRAGRAADDLCDPPKGAVLTHSLLSQRRSFGRRRGATAR